MIYIFIAYFIATAAAVNVGLLLIVIESRMYSALAESVAALSAIASLYSVYSYLKFLAIG